MTKRYGTVIVGVLLIIAVILYLSGGISFHHSSGKNRDIISRNVAELAAEETEAISQTITSALDPEETTEPAAEETEGTGDSNTEAEQQKIISMENDSFDNADLTRRFRGCVIVGDSIAHAGLEYEWLTESNYAAKIGVSIATGSDQINAAISARPSVMFLNFGVNDIEHYVSDVDSFIEDYREALDKVQKETPSTRIYVCSLFPPEEGVEETKTFYQYLDEYNERLEDLCKEMNVNYIDCTFLLRDMPDLYDADGIHPVYRFYPLWFTYIADVAELPND